jgi:hypothetical protein
MNAEQSPWFDADGNLKSDDAIKAISGTWDADIWERFLNETVTSGMRESQISNHAFDLVLEGKTETMFSTVEQKAVDPAVITRIHEIRKHKLSDQQRRVVDFIYWAGLSERDVAGEMGLSRSTVVTLKDRSLNKFKKFLPNPSAVYPRVKEPLAICGSRKEKTRDEQIKEVYRQDLTKPKHQF